MMFASNLPESMMTGFLAGFLTGYMSLTVEAKQMMDEMPSEDKYNKINFGKQYLYVPLMYGVIAMLLILVVRNFFPKELDSYWFLGALMGVIIPSIKMIDNYALEVYDTTEFSLYLWDISVYAFFWGFVLQTIFFLV